MGLFDSMVKMAKREQEKAIISSQNRLYDAYHSTDDAELKKSINKTIRENTEMLRQLRSK